jgi:hypothetical protein
VTPGASVDNLYYDGPFSNIGLARLSSNTWQYQGIRNTTRYTEAWANLKCQTSTDSVAPFAIGVALNDQQGNTASYNIAVTVTDLAEYSAPVSIDWSEGLEADITPIEILDLAVEDPDYLVTLTVANADHALILLDGSAANSRSITGNRTELNASLLSNPPVWQPKGDFAFTDTVALTIQRLSDSVILANAVSITMNITSTHNEYAVPASIVFDEDQTANVTGISITDVRWDNPTYTVTVAAANTTASLVTFGSNTGASVTQVGTKTVLNALLANVAFVPAADLDQNTTINYTQIRNSDGEVHANAVPINMLINSTHNDFAVPATVTVIGGQSFTLNGFDITDQAVNKNYQVTVTTVPTQLTFERNSNTVANYQVSGNIATVDSAINGNWTFNPSRYYYGGNAIVTYRQVQTTDNIVQANNFPITVQVIEDPLFYFSDTNFRSPVGNIASLPQYFNIDPNQNSYVYNSSLTVMNTQITDARLIYNGGSPQAVLNFSGTAAQLQANLSLVTVVNYANTAQDTPGGAPTGKYIRYTQTNAVTGITEGYQDFWDHTNIEFGGVRTWQDYWTAAVPIDTSWPRRSVMMNSLDPASTYTVTLYNTLNVSPFSPISAPNNFRFLPVRSTNSPAWFSSDTGTFVDGSTWIECADAVITLTGAEMAEQFHWVNFQVLGLDDYEYRRFIVQNDTANVQVTSGVAVVDDSTLAPAISHDRIIVQLSQQP